MKLLVNCRAYAFDPQTRRYTRHAALGFDGAHICGLDAAEFGNGVERIDLGGATVVPAFADCHVHFTETGYSVGERDLRGVRSAAAFGDRIARLEADGEYLMAANFDDSAWPDGAADARALERFHPTKMALLTRVDAHSCLVNRRTFDELALDPALAGIERDAAGDPTGRLFLEANWAAQSHFYERIPESVRRASERRAYGVALAAGAVHLHAQLLGLHARDAYAQQIEALRGLGPLKWYPKICEREPAFAAELGLPFIGGDVFLDGSLGSGTAALCAPYADRPGEGELALDDAEVRDFFARAERLGISAGVHAIGDRAIEQCLDAWDEVLEGRPSTRARHFIEHFELATPAQIARGARLGLLLSMQPQFDASWGAPGGMYETRLGSERARSMNALRSALDAGATLCGGDDSPVCELSPLRGMAAACAHNSPAQRLEPLEALTMYTADAARLGHAEDRAGRLAPGFAADLVVLDRDPFDDASFAATRVLQTWIDGAIAYDAGRA
jgi:predicted amidohydrolase YtcJ